MHGLHLVLLHCQEAVLVYNVGRIVPAPSRCYTSRDIGLTLRTCVLTFLVLSYTGSRWGRRVGGFHLENGTPATGTLEEGGYELQIYSISVSASVPDFIEPREYQFSVVPIDAPVLSPQKEPQTTKSPVAAPVE